MNLSRLLVIFFFLSSPFHSFAHSDARSSKNFDLHPYLSSKEKHKNKFPSEKEYKKERKLNEELKKISFHCTEIVKQAQEKENSLSRTMNNSVEVANTLNKAAELYESAAKIIDDAKELIQSSSNRMQLHSEIQNQKNYFEKQAKRCRKEAIDWPKKVQIKKNEYNAEIDLLKKESVCLEQQGLWHNCREAYKRLALHQEKQIENGNPYTDQFTNFLSKIAELNALADKQRLIHAPFQMSPMEFKELEAIRRKNFYVNEKFTKTHLSIAIPLDGQDTFLYSLKYYRYLIQREMPSKNLKIKVLENSVEIHEELIQIPAKGDIWEHYLRADKMLLIPDTDLKSKYGLELRLTVVPDPYYGFSLVIAQKGLNTKHEFRFYLDDQPLYDLYFISPPPWQLESILKPPFSDVKTALLENSELEIIPANDDGLRHPTETISYPALDQFIKDMKNDPLALAQYVHNEIEFADPFLIREYSIFKAPSIHRNPLRTYLENQGSPWEQCTLLVYLLQHAGYQAQYIEGTCTLPAHYVERLLFLQLLDEKEVMLNYPGVLFHDGQNWHTLFPWMKEINIIEGHNLYSLMPDEYGNAERWLKHYLTNDENILKHAALDDDDTVGVLFVRFVQEQLRNQGLSLQDVGTHRRINKKQFTCWQEFPRPCIHGPVKGSASLFSRENLFAKIKIQFYSDQNPGNVGETNWLNFSSYSCGTFDIHFSNQGPNEQLLHICSAEDRNQEFKLPLNNNDRSIKIEIAYESQFSIKRTQQIFTILKGTNAALCFHSGSSNTKLTSFFAEQLNDKNTADEKLHALLAFVGASYFEKCSNSSKILATLHKIKPTTYFCVGLSKLSPSFSSFDNSRFPQVDMQHQVFSIHHHKHPFSLYQEVHSAVNQYNILAIADISANEHQVLREIYQDPHAISTVKLLQIAHQNHKNKGLPGLGFLHFTAESYTLSDRKCELASLLYFSQMDKIDLNYIKHTAGYQWDQLYDFFRNDNQAHAYMTPGLVSSQDGYGLNFPSYTGIGTLAFSNSSAAAWISSGSFIMNGGYGTRLPDSFMQTINSSDWKLVSKGNKYNLLRLSDEPILKIGDISNPSSKFDLSTTFKLENKPDQSYIGWNESPWKIPTAKLKSDVRQGFKSPLDLVADPVDVITGAFYIDEPDLTLPGAFPLEIRRNYNSQNPLPGVFGFGWKLNLNPILFEEEDKLFASEQDGTVIVYRRVDNQNRWNVLPEDNPGLKNYNLKGIGGTANPFHAYIEKDTVHILHGTDGSKRVFQNKLLTTWSDHAGNTLTFSYKDDQLRNIESSSGGLICLEYNYGGKISEVYAKDGRRITYTYDFQGNLASVTFPNNAITSYEYDSLHRIIRETKPHGRVLENIYQDDKVVEQRSPVGQQQYIVTSATFAYREGMTIVTDGSGGQTEYKINNHQIYKITDPEGYQTLQSWFIDEKSFFDAESEMIQPWNSSNGYMRSMKSSKDKRGLTTNYLYDSQGNTKEITIEGDDLTGNGDKSISTSFTYNANNLCIEEETLNTKSVTTYDSALSFLPKRVEKYIDDTLISFIDLEYTSNGLVKNNNHCGAITIWEYDDRDFPVKKTQKTGTDDPDVVTRYLFNNQGQCINVITADGIEHNEYDIVGNNYCCTISLPSGKILSKTYAGYDLNNALTWKQGDDLNDTVFFDYNSAGLLKASRKKLSQINGTEFIPSGTAYTLYEYDACGRLTEKVDPLGNCTYNNNDSLGRVVTTTKNGITTRFTYEAGGLVASITNPGGATTSRSYTTNGLIKNEINPDGTQSSCTYDLFGRQITVVNNDLTSTITYNDADYEEIRSVGDQKEIHRFDSRGNLVSLTDKAGFIWTKSYDALNRIKTEISPNNEITTWNYQGNKIVCTLPNGEKAIQIYEAGTVVESQTLDVDGAIISKTSCVREPSQSLQQDIVGDIVVTTWNNTLNLPIRIQQGNKITTHFYDACGNCVGTIDGEGNISCQKFDPSGRLIQKTLPDGANINYEYDSDSNVTAYHMPGGQSWKATYDCMGRKTSEWQESKGIAFQHWEYTYKDGLLVQTQDPLKRLHNYGYDSYSRLISENVGGFARTFTYDPRGYIANISESGNDLSTVERDYDASGRLIQEVISLNGVIIQNSQQKWTPSCRTLQIGDHTRDFHYSGGRLKNLSTKDINLSYEYAQSGSLIKKTTPLSTLAIQYNEASLPHTIDVQLSKNPHKESLEWTISGKLASFEATYPKAEASNYKYTPRGFLKSGDEGIFSFDFDQPGCGIRTAAPDCEVPDDGLDEFGRIVKESSKTTNNITTSTTAYDDMGQVVIKDTDQFLWDPWGRLTDVISDKYEWKATYDALGRRLQTTYTPINAGYFYTSEGAPAVTTSFYDPQHEFQEIGVSYGNKTFWKLYGSIACEAILDSSGNTVVLHHDMKNNLQAVVTTKTIVWNDDYPTPYGPRGPPETEIPDLLSYAKSLTWQSKQMDPTGLIWLGARYYDPAGGRFLSTDPVSHPMCLDLYAYANGDPINNCDLDGRFSSPVYDTISSTTSATSKLPKVRSSNTFEEFVSADNRTRRFDLGFHELPHGLRVGFINGIQNDFERDFKKSIRYLSDFSGGHNIHGLYSAAMGLENDLIACIYGLKHVDTGRVGKLHDTWDEHFELNPDSYYLHFCHSRGAIDTCNALLVYSEEKRKKIIVVAIAPAAYIYEHSCAKVYHYRAASWCRDFIPRLDSEGAERMKHTITDLISDSQASWIDHSFNSPTYAPVIRWHISSYIENKGIQK